MRHRFRFWVGCACGALALILSVATTRVAGAQFGDACSNDSRYRKCPPPPRRQPQTEIPGRGGILIPIIFNNLPPVQNPVPKTGSSVPNSDAVPRRKVPPKATPRIAHNDRRPPVTPPKPPATRSARAFPPPPNEFRFRGAEVLVELPANAVGADIDRMLRRHGVAEIESFPVALLGTTLHLWRFPDSRAVGAVVTEIGGEPLVASVQPNYIYTLQQDASVIDLPTAEPDAMAYYAMAKLHIDEARALASGAKVLVAVLDTAIDETHPDLSGTVEKRFDAILCTGWHRANGAPAGCAATQPAQDGAIDRAHGTSIAGAIAARGRFPSVAPQVRLLQVRAFDAAQSGQQGTSRSIIRGADWAWQSNASVINMSFAGPADPMLGRVLAAAFGKGVTLIASAGNEGRSGGPRWRRSPPPTRTSSP